MERQYAAAMGNVGASVQRLCQERGLSLSETERRAGLGRRRGGGKSHLSQIIAGRKKPRGRTLLRLAKVLGAGTLTSDRVRFEKRLRAAERALRRKA